MAIFPDLIESANLALDAYGLAGARLSPMDGGLINRTYRVDAAEASYVLQWVNPIFDPRMHDDIEAVTQALAANGLVTPRLVRTLAGELHARALVGAQEGVWRVMTFIAGRTFQRVTSAALAEAAGALVGRFHRAVDAVDCSFHYARTGVHDTPAHLRRLRDSLASHANHAEFAHIAPLAKRILNAADALPPLPATPARAAHGDLKISNVLFEETREAARCLVDLDTLSRMPIAVELGDALRSWCNPLGEEAPDSAVEPALFAAALRGYARGTASLLTAEERGSLVLGMQTIALELAARFCADALEEHYFGWDATRFRTRSEHNRVRATSQLALAESVARSASALEAAARGAFAA